MKKQLLLASFFAFAFSLPTLNAQNIYTLAGNGWGAPIGGGFSGDGGPAINAELNIPIYAAVNAAGDIFIADNGNSRIRKVDHSTFIITTIAGNGTMGFSGDGGQATAAELSYPLGIKVDATGNIYFSDEINHRIRKINTNGIISTIAGSANGGYAGDGGQATNAELFGPYGITFDATGNLYIADAGDYLVRKVNTNGIISTLAGKLTQGYSGDGGQATAALLSNPSGVACDATGNVYIADYTTNTVRKVTVGTGIITTIAGSGSAGFAGDGGQATASALNHCYCVNFDATGNLYIGDVNNARIRMINTSGVINTICGAGVQAFTGDGGPATAADVQYPTDIAFDAAGNIYIVDGGNGRVRDIGNVTGIDEITQKYDVTVYPNPSEGKYSVQVSNTKLEKNNTFEIYTMLGQKVYSVKFEIRNSQFLIDLSNQPSGIYIYKVVSESGAMLGTGKLVKE